MIVYRVENDKGDGPYVGNQVGPHATPYPHYDEGGRCPSPYGDGLGAGGWPPNARFGFASARQLVQWFVRRDRRFMASHQGYQLALYEVDGRKVRKGGKQVIFSKQDATLIERRPLCAASNYVSTLRTEEPLRLAA